MARRNRENEFVKIHSIANNGFAVGRTREGMVVFVEGAVPGDEIEVAYFAKKKGNWFGKIHELLVPSKSRVSPHCRHFGVCGGCSWQNISYEEQLLQKEQWVKDAVMRIAKIREAVFEPILAANETEYYRNKLEFTFSEHRWKLGGETQAESDSNKAVGFHRPGHFQKVVDIHHCFHQGGKSNEIRNFIRSFSLEQNWEYYDIKTHHGFLRNLTVRSTSRHEIMCILSFGYADSIKINLLTKALVDKFPEIKSIYIAINNKYNDSLYDLDLELKFGDAFLTEVWDRVKFLIGPKSFFQTNPKQAQVLFNLIESYCDLKGGETIVDLYCGVGSIGIYLAHTAKKLIGLETVPSAVEDAQKNAAINQLQNCEFHTAVAETVELSNWILGKGDPDIVVVDPPRMGLHESVCLELNKLKVSKLIYVSCNPSTLARDLDRLSSVYQVIKIRAVDMFPHTNHVESVTLLSLRT
ncbi:MAG: 23S rRNA (uracil(1939)-C(5))-methyltransferase RlmD [Saprospiraceae bacterium]|nr:23S rRNA (uracil(1939)-C(5))-methyltransferase RlmD [Saprospiraceae bacterium]